jgi:hypothetical protein
MTNNHHVEAIINAIINNEYPLDHCKKLIRSGVFYITLTKDQFQGFTNNPYVAPIYLQWLKAKPLKPVPNNDSLMGFQIYGIKFSVKLEDAQ